MTISRGRTTEVEGRQRKTRAAQKRKQADMEVLSNLPLLWDEVDLALALRCDPLWLKLLTWTMRPSWEDISWE